MLLLLEAMRAYNGRSFCLFARTLPEEGFYSLSFFIAMEMATRMDRAYIETGAAIVDIAAPVLFDY